MKIIILLSISFIMMLGLASCDIQDDYDNTRRNISSDSYFVNNRDRNKERVPSTGTYFSFNMDGGISWNGITQPEFIASVPEGEYQEWLDLYVCSDEYSSELKKQSHVLYIRANLNQDGTVKSTSVIYEKNKNTTPPDMCELHMVENKGNLRIIKKDSTKVTCEFRGSLINLRNEEDVRQVSIYMQDVPVRKVSKKIIN